jgi:hypothetical protein
MPDAKTILAILGPLLFALGALRAWQTGRVVAQARTWLIVGAIFSAVAAWLWSTAPA